jgi:YggT family protein
MEAICTLLSIYSLVIIARLIMSWVRVEPGTPMASVYSVLLSLTEPVLRPLRNAIPPVRMGVTALDLSPIIVFVVIRLVCG